MSSNQLRWLPAGILDPEQRSIIDSFNLVKSGKMLVYGPAGSGKTSIILYWGKNLSDLQRSFKIIVYTNMLQKFIEAGAADLNLPPDSVTTLYRWVWRLHDQQIGRPPEYPDGNKFSHWVDNLIAHWRKHPSSAPRYNYLLVDEAQDFTDNVSTLLHMLSENLLVVADPTQSLYVDTKDLDTLVRRWKPIDSSREIPYNYRNTVSIAQVASLFLDPRRHDAQDFVRRVKGRPGNTVPIWHQVQSSEEQIDKICQIIAETRGSVRIGLLYRHRKHLEQDYNAFQKRHVSVQLALTQSANIDFNRPLPVMTTAHSAKGLEFDWVILPSLDTDKWDGDPKDDKERNLFFVALTRAKERLYLISTKGKECAFLTKIVTERPDLIQTARPRSDGTHVFHSSTATATINDDDPF